MKVSRLPSLAALKAFEAVGRNLSFQRAADELCLTPSAISHQVRTLEEHLRCRLFVRRHHELELTSIGRSYLGRVQGIISELLDATAEIIDQNGNSPLVIQICPSLATTWLIRRLQEFTAENVGLDMTVVSPYEDPHFLLPEVDLGILYGTGSWTGVKAEYMMGETIIPVCSPEYLQAAPPLKRPQDLAEHTLIRCSSAAVHEWALWLEMMGVSSMIGRQHIRMHDRDQVIEAAAAGIGIGMGRRPLIDDRLLSGELVMPFDRPLPSRSAYYLVYADQESQLPRINAFRKWILAAGAATDALTIKPRRRRVA